MPYFGWTLRTKQPREAQLRLANRFSDWLVARYGALAFDAASPLHVRQQGYIRTLIEADRESLVLIWAVIDGLTCWQVSVTDEAVAEDQLLGLIMENRSLKVKHFGRKTYNLEEVFLDMVRKENSK